MKFLRKTEVALCVALILCIGFNFFSFGKSCQEIRKDVLRLHILANSDSDKDQALKCKVRDAVLRENRAVFENVNTVEQAKEKVSANLADIQNTTIATLRQNGCNMDVSVRLETAFFETRYYRDFTLPAGEYEAVRIVIGSGKGHNWWCVMFPQMCLAASAASSAECLSDEEKRLIFSDPQFEVRFKFVELYEKFKKYL